MSSVSSKVVTCGAAGTSTPSINVIIPVFNRASTLDRAIRSALQLSTSVTVTVVDDASTDVSREVARRHLGHRVSLIERPMNGGVCAARATGIDASTSDWILLLDSDDELVPNWYEVVYSRLVTVEESLAAIYYRRLADTGDITPPSITMPQKLGYVSYVQLLEASTMKRSDTCVVLRRNALDVVPYPRGRVPEIEFHLALLERFSALFAPEAVYLFHSDGADRLTLAHLNRARPLDHEIAEGDSWWRILVRHQSALSVHAPHIFKSLILRAAVLLSLTGQVRKVAILAMLRKVPLHIRLASLFILLLGSFSKRGLRVLRGARFQIRNA